MGQEMREAGGEKMGYKECRDCAGWMFCERSYPAGYDVSRECKKYEPAESFVRLPFKVGQKVWFLRKTTGGKRKVTYTEIRRFIFKVDGLYLKLSCDMGREFPARYIGKLIFGTMQEAEDALAEKQGA